MNSQLGRVVRVVAFVATPLFAMGCSKPAFEKIPEASIDAKRKAAAEKFGNTVMTAWSKDTYPQVTAAEADEEFRKGHNDVARQKAADKTIEGAFGNFKSMSFHEALRSNPPKHEVFRFKGTFDKGVAEVRVTVDLDGKIAGHFVVPWKD